MRNKANRVFQPAPNRHIFRLADLLMRMFIRASVRSQKRRQWMPIMSGFSASVHRAVAKLDPFQVAARLPNRDEYGTLILDRAGRIISCGTPAEDIFGAARQRIVGRWISDFVLGLFPASNSPSYRARHLLHLCNHGDWRKFPAMEAGGRRFMVELNLARMVTDGQEIFVLNVRRSDAHIHAQGFDRVQAPVHSIE